MDSGALDYDSLWLTSSLRGICLVDFKIEGGALGYHSGTTGGVIPETFRIARTLLDRLDDSTTGKVCEELQVEVPEWKQKEAESLAAKYGENFYNKYNLVEGVKYMN